MRINLKNKNVVLIGATGGLGHAYATKLIDKGCNIFIGGRNLVNVSSMATLYDCKYACIDITDFNSVLVFSEAAKNALGDIDYIINATGYDVRKPLNDHTQIDIDRSLDVNLRGAIYISRVFLPIMKDYKGSTIVNMGGFVDRGLAFPYYSADVASRAGIYSFTESMNRELKQEGSLIRITYFCPNAADTAAERPFHPIWKEMKTKINTPDEVADFLIRALEKAKNNVIMGGFTYSLGAKINHISTSLSNTIIMNQYSKILRKYLGSSNDQSNTSSKQLKKSNIILSITFCILSFLIYLLVPVIYSTSCSHSMKTILLIVVNIVSWTLFGISGVLGLKEITSSIKKCLCK